MVQRAINGGRRLTNRLAVVQQAHAASATMRSQIERVCQDAGYEPAIICTPDELMEPEDGND